MITAQIGTPQIVTAQGSRQQFPRSSRLFLIHWAAATAIRRQGGISLNAGLNLHFKPVPQVFGGWNSWYDEAQVSDANWGLH